MTHGDSLSWKSARLIGEKMRGSSPAPRIIWRQKLGLPECPYIERWMINFGRLGSLRLHHWLRSDDKRAKHDHPADFVTLVLKGSYTDFGAEINEHMTVGKVRFRKAEHTHTVAVDPPGCWTLLWFLPDRRNWGFYTRRKDGSLKWKKANKYFLEDGHHPCSQL